jgi:N-acetyltransferase
MGAAPLDLRRDAYQCYVVAEGRRVLGLCLAEPIAQAHAARPHADPAMVCALAGDGPVPAALGIARIWVAPERRKRGLATALLDAVRAAFAEPLVVGKRMLAFSQPTAAGYALAASYVAPLQPLVYL